MNQTAQIQSNIIRGSFKDEIVDSTMNEIHDVIKTVFGPGAADAYIIKDNAPYYTRDGKEVLNALTFNNPVSNYVKRLMYQAVERQGVKIGDGTTTLSMLYTNLYAIMRRRPINATLTDLRQSWNRVVKRINANLETRAIHDLTEDQFASMIYTCTQDIELTKKFTESVSGKIAEGAYVMVNKASSDDELEVVVNDKPLLKAELLTSLFPLTGETFDACTLFVNGPLDIANSDSFANLAQQLVGGRPRSIIILCSSTSEVTRKAFREFSASVASIGRARNVNMANHMNNIIIMRIPGLMSYPEEAVEDMVSYFYGVVGISGVCSSITFESLLWQALPCEDITNESLESYMFDPKLIQTVQDTFRKMYPVEYSELQGIRFDMPLNPVAQNRYDELRAQINEEKSVMKRGDMVKRLKSLYGQFVEVNVGSKLLKDGQRKYELVLDAVLSAVQAKTYGALTDNSIVMAYIATSEVIHTLCNTEGTPNRLDVWWATCILDGLRDVIVDMMDNVYTLDLSGTNFVTEGLIGAVEGYQHRDSDETKPIGFNLHRSNLDDVFNPDVFDPDLTIGDYSIHDMIVEPLPIITTLLENSVMIVELAMAKAIGIDTFIGNYIG